MNAGFAQELIKRAVEEFASLMYKNAVQEPHQEACWGQQVKKYFSEIVILKTALEKECYFILSAMIDLRSSRERR